MKLKQALLIWMLIVALVGQSKANNTIHFREGEELKDIGFKLFIAEDKSGQLTFQQAKKLPYVLSTSEVPNLGISESAFWVKFDVVNHSRNTDLMLELSLPILDEIRFFFPTGNGEYDCIITGEEFPFYERQVKDPNYLFNLDLINGESKTYYFKIRSSEAIQLPIKIGTKDAFINRIKSRDVLSGIYFGVMLVMIFYNLFIYFMVRDRSYILYVIYILLILLTQTSLQGYPFQYLWSNTPIIAKYSLFVFPSLVSIAGILFMLVFLKVKSYNSNLHYLSYLFFGSYSISIILAFFSKFQFSFVIMEFSSMTVSVYMLITAIYIARKGYVPAKYFVAAWVVFLCGVFIYILKDFEVLPFNNFTRYTMQIGSGIETILLSFALAARINIYKRERLEAVKEKEQILREQNELLEEEVAIRTKELNKTLDKLKNTQVQLVDAEKMSSLGQLTAGIAHEINNPINFVSSNIGPLRQDLDDLKAILQKYEELNEKNADEKLAEIQSLKNQLDYEYLKKELVSIVNGIEDGAKRTMEIVSGLRNFSRLDEGDLKLADLNVGVQSTLVLINNKLGDIQVEVNYADKAEIECNAGKINQVIMNLIDNAIDAIKEKYENVENGRIKINVKGLEDYVQLSITDNGSGIPEDIKKNIFDPFFTTKDVGLGTGLGLSIVKGILENHNATCKIISTQGEGTTFIITLPKTKRDGKD